MNGPLFLNDRELGALLLGPKRADEFEAYAPALEVKGLPKHDPDMPGKVRYVPAVLKWFDARYFSRDMPQAPDGVEQLGTYRKRRA